MACLKQEKLGENEMKNNWKILNEITLARIIVLNRRREGEVSKMRMSDFANVHNGIQEGAIMNFFTPLECHLCAVLSRVEIIEKCGTVVAVLLTQDLRDCIN